mmetsp:Transcript_35766/g.75315  ORF Transcript_35766/g.75315 Transcript_35766/m.75315 type:complete len:519 (-) Transcript_35766:1441-2997(-)
MASPELINYLIARIMSDKKPSPENTEEKKASADLAAEIAENNAELTEQLVDAIKLTNSLNGIAPSNSGPLNLDSFLGLPGAASASSNSSAQSLAAPPLAVTAQALGPNATTAPSTQDLSLLSLLSASSNFLTPSDMALPPNDPSFFLPTPFAPGENANTILEQEKEQQQEHRQQPPYTTNSITPLGAGAPNPTPSLTVSMPTVPPQQQLLQQLAAAYGVGGHPTAFGVTQPIFPQAPAGGTTVPALNFPVGGNLNSMVNVNGLNLFSPGVARLPSGLNTGTPAGLPPGLNRPAISASIPQGLNHPSLASLANLGNFSNAPTNSGASTAPSLPTNHAMHNAMALQTQPSLVNRALDDAASAAKKMPDDPSPQQNSDSTANKDSSSNPADNDMLIKSREARWIIRYNELLEFRQEHGHCRVPHGYAPNRKLSWWVMNQRAQFAYRNQGKKTWLSDDRIQLLNDIGFIWTPHLKRTGGGKKKAAPKSKSGVTEKGAANEPSESKDSGKGKKEEKSEDSSGP